METENSQKLFSVSITHNSKIRELSDGNRVMETELLFGQTTYLLWIPPFLSYELWKLRIELWKLLVQTGSKSFCFLIHFLLLFIDTPLRVSSLSAIFIFRPMSSNLSKVINSPLGLLGSLDYEPFFWTMPGSKAPSWPYSLGPCFVDFPFPTFANFFLSEASNQPTKNPAPFSLLNISIDTPCWIC